MPRRDRQGCSNSRRAIARPRRWGTKQSRRAKRYGACFRPPAGSIAGVVDGAVSAILRQVDSLGYATSVHRMGDYVEMHAMLLADPELLGARVQRGPQRR